MRSGFCVQGVLALVAPPWAALCRPFRPWFVWGGFGLVTWVGLLVGGFISFLALAGMALVAFCGLGPLWFFWVSVWWAALLLGLWWGLGSGLFWVGCLGTRVVDCLGFLPFLGELPRTQGCAPVFAFRTFVLLSLHPGLHYVGPSGLGLFGVGWALSRGLVFWLGVLFRFLALAGMALVAFCGLGAIMVFFGVWVCALGWLARVMRRIVNLKWKRGWA